MTIAPFVDGQILTAAQLNALVTELNKLELVLDVPAPLFQREELGTSDHPGGPAAFHYLIMHKEDNRYLRYTWQWGDPGPNSNSRVFVVNSGHMYDLSDAPGVWSGSVDLLPLNIPAGNLYAVTFEVDRDNSGQFILHNVFEAPWL